MRYKYMIAAAEILLLAVLVLALLQKVIREPSVRFSEEEAFQEEAFELSLEGGLFGGAIYYTLDGSDPTLDSPVYEKPIPIEAGLPDRVTVVKAAMLTGGQLGEIRTRTYFVGEGASSLFDTMVVSLSADPKVLYDEETGILSNFQERGEDGEWDRPAYIEFYEADGRKMLAQGTGIAVSGNASRAFDQKSIKLISGREYDPDHETFDYDFFDADMGGNKTGQSYNRLVLRNGGNDHNGTMIRWNVVSRLAREAGMICAGARPGVLFLNGEYYGIIQLQEKYTRYNIAHALRAREQDVEKFQQEESYSSRFGGYYSRLHEDLNDPERQEKLETSVDIQDMLRYYAMNIMMNNLDWPYNNYLSFRCAKNSVSAYGDERVRFLLYDLDTVWQDLNKEEIYLAFDYLMEEPPEDVADAFSLLMRSDKYRTQFVNLICDLTSTVYTEEQILKTIEEENAKIAHSMELYAPAERRSAQQAALEELKSVAASSGAQMRLGLIKHLGAERPYTMKLEVPEGMTVSFSQIQIKEPGVYTGVYYHNYPLTLSATPGEGQEFYGWLVNGEEIREPELLLDDRYTADELEIKLITSL